jgi:hypothetical protein
MRKHVGFLRGETVAMVYRLRVTANLFPKAGHSSAELNNTLMLTKSLEYALNRRVDHVRTQGAPGAGMLEASGACAVTFNVDGWPGDVDFMMRALPTMPEVAFNSERVVIEAI